MSRTLLVVVGLVGSNIAHAESSEQPETEASVTETVEDGLVEDQEIGAEVGIATGGRVTPGGLRVAGHYLYQLSESDWFDGGASFTYGGGGAACRRDAMEAMACDHDLADGSAVVLSASVRRWFSPQ